MLFEWDPKKAAANLAKHGVSFEEAAASFEDRWHIDERDLQHSSQEPRRRRVGRAVDGRLLMVVYTRRNHAEEEPVRYRLISARQANREERAAYARPR